MHCVADSERCLHPRPPGPVLDRLRALRQVTQDIGRDVEDNLNRLRTHIDCHAQRVRDATTQFIHAQCASSFSLRPASPHPSQLLTSYALSCAGPSLFIATEDRVALSAQAAAWQDGAGSGDAEMPWWQSRSDDAAGASVRDPGRKFTIVTTAALPWMTGTSINPLLRAHFLASNRPDRQVSIFVPWLSLPDQQVVFPGNIQFTSPSDQEQYIRNWLESRTGCSSQHVNLQFYPGRYAPEKGSILPVGDITSYVPDRDADVAVLEEPEHLNWYHHGRRWTDKFEHVVGVMHTNYLDYARRESGGTMKANILRAINSLVCRIHCHKVIKLSDAVQDLPRQCTQFVHGVSPRFLQVGELKAAAATASAQLMLRGGGEGSANPLASLASAAAAAADAAAAAAPAATVGAAAPVWRDSVYFLGKVVWAKGYTELLDLLEYHHKKSGLQLPVDVYGSGDDKPAVEARAREADLQLTFHGAKDHADESLHDIKVFVNPSLSDVVATTTAEALAMGKWVVCADHPSNRFFSSFSNCIIYHTPDEFAEKLQFALSNDPQPLSSEDLRRLSWEAATERFLSAAEIGTHERAGLMERTLDSVAYAAHNTLTGVEFLRVNAGAGAHTKDTPARVTDYIARPEDTGGLLDDRSRAAKVRSGRP